MELVELEDDHESSYQAGLAAMLPKVQCLYPGRQSWLEMKLEMVGEELSIKQTPLYSKRLKCD